MHTQKHTHTHTHNALRSVLRRFEIKKQGYEICLEMFSFLHLISEICSLVHLHWVISSVWLSSEQIFVQRKLYTRQLTQMNDLDKRNTNWPQFWLDCNHIITMNVDPTRRKRASNHRRNNWNQALVLLFSSGDNTRIQPVRLLFLPISTAQTHFCVVLRKQTSLVLCATQTLLGPTTKTSSDSDSVQKSHRNG